MPSVLLIRRLEDILCSGWWYILSSLPSWRTQSSRTNWSLCRTPIKWAGIMLSCSYPVGYIFNEVIQSFCIGAFHPLCFIHVMFIEPQLGSWPKIHHKNFYRNKHTETTHTSLGTQHSSSFRVFHHLQENPIDIPEEYRNSRSQRRNSSFWLGKLRKNLLWNLHLSYLVGEYDLDKSDGKGRRIQTNNSSKGSR